MPIVFNQSVLDKNVRTVAFITYYLLPVLVLSTNLDHTHHMFHKLLKLLDSKTLSLFMPSITTKPNLGLTLVTVGIVFSLSCIALCFIGFFVFVLFYIQHYLCCHFK